MSHSNNLRMIRKHYAQSVISELQQMGYSFEQARAAFFRHYRDLKRAYGLEPNVSDFAKMIDDFERAINHSYNSHETSRVITGPSKKIFDAEGEYDV